jgi:dsRNA-specific ribonuclease
MRAPAYSVVETVGPPHARKFTVEAVWETGKTRAAGSTIKAAEMKAAEEALRKLDPAKLEDART